MNKQLFFIIIAMCFVGIADTSFAQQYKQAIMTDPLDLINTSRFNIRYEQMLTKKNSFTAELVYDYNYNNVHGFVVGAAYRWYFRNLFPDVKTSGIEGLIVAPYARLGIYRHKLNTNNYDNDLGLEIGGEVAYKWVFGGFAVEPIIRLGIGATGPEYYNKGFHPWPGVSIGYAW